MSFGALPAAVVAGVTVAAWCVVVLLYLRRVERRRIAVPFGPLWRRALAEHDRRALRFPKQLASLLFQLTIVALIAMAAGAPRFESDARGAAPRTLVIAVDCSGSMQAMDAPALGKGKQRHARIAEARDAARSIVRGMSPRDRASIVRLDGEPRPLGGFTSDQESLLRGIASLDAGDAPADLLRGLALSAGLLAGSARPELFLIGDGAWPAADLSRVHVGASPSRPFASDDVDLSRVDLRFVFVGGSGQNLAITAFEARRSRADPSVAEAFVEVRSFCDAPSNVLVELRSAGTLVGSRPIELSPGATQSLVFDDVATNDSRLESYLRVEDNAGCDDVLAADDHAFAIVPPRPKLRVLLVSAGNLFLEGALLLDETTRLTERAPDAWPSLLPSLARDFDAVVLDGYTPPEPPPVPALYVDPHGSASPFRVGRTLAAPPLTDIDAEHPVMRHVSLSDVNLRRASVFAREPGDVALASSVRDAVMVARASPRRMIALGFDLRRSDLPLRVGFPVLIENALAWLIGDATASLPSWRVGAPESVAVSGADGTRAVIVDPDGARVETAIVDGRASFRPLRTGVHSVRAVGGEAVLAAALFDPAESAIRARSVLTLDGKSIAPPDRSQLAAVPVSSVRRVLGEIGRDATGGLVLLAIALLAVELVTFHRRITE